MSKIYEKRTDCEDFEAKQFEWQCGDCQTDGHYLCAGCKHIASFDNMELSDNRMSFYSKLEKQRVEKEIWEIEQDQINLQNEAI